MKNIFFNFKINFISEIYHRLDFIPFLLSNEKSFVYKNIPSVKHKPFNLKINDNFHFLKEILLSYYPLYLNQLKIYKEVF